MRRFIGFGVAALLLAACNQPAQQVPADAAETTAPEVAVPVEAPVAQTPAPAADNPDFPAGFQPSFGYSIRSRKVEDATNGQSPVRKLVIEFKQGDALTVDKQIEELLLAKGYKRYKTFERGDDLVGDYGNSGKRITVTTTPANGKLKLAEDSLGTVYFVWTE
ncbi:hypothetical protein [Pseudoxanthomonas japonensis]|uniref:Lipoprotein n=1 Tax=Pseudoxanthomonas japonensis TaxID=69284 RepID=A0ABQ6ZJB5_9GAMM|nr:hypothetical protein [Pseudoxanthomonas japonensis]KAF1726183.1 hypothetical protein CSC78_05845 [Pseudoxanthomonas japonensis]